MTAHSAGLNAGATFTVRLSVIAKMPQRDAGPDPRIDEPKRAQVWRILLVEDHEETLHILAKLLTRLGHEVTTASTIKRALQPASQQPFDLVIRDLGLPDGLGYKRLEEAMARVLAVQK